jgi:hypothetical protein
MSLSPFDDCNGSTYMKMAGTLDCYSRWRTVRERLAPAWQLKVEAKKPFVFEGDVSGI